ncbi:hypothetical protein EJ03DRAFT_33958 [Teratosphaeria nubilosa]|uniref:Uncharacterized protein n=1 Tax=Teratosphaeria nubilosa TaxID=161662 RepID=A0A6G1KUC4_9PEZI|nr:hypothetical protein EJ03DRAFT_33958 [Teratosphaeria nubilosa]
MINHCWADHLFVDDKCAFTHEGCKCTLRECLRPSAYWSIHKRVPWKIDSRLKINSSFTTRLTKQSIAGSWPYAQWLPMFPRRQVWLGAHDLDTPEIGGEVLYINSTHWVVSGQVRSAVVFFRDQIPSTQRGLSATTDCSRQSFPSIWQRHPTLWSEIPPPGRRVKNGTLARSRIAFWSSALAKVECVTRSGYAFSG